MRNNTEIFMRQIETKGMMEQFQAHLNNTNNQRIIFSGCFGSGKTTFLNNFFNKNQNSINM